MVRPDQVLPPDGARIQVRELVGDVILIMPNLVKLVARLLRDQRVPRRAKIAVAFAAAYVVSPVDLIPDKIPVVGWVDDILIMMFALDSIIQRAGPEVVEELWDGPGDLLALVRDIVSLARYIVPRRFAVVIDRVSG